MRRGAVEGEVVWEWRQGEQQQLREEEQNLAGTKRPRDCEYTATTTTCSSTAQQCWNAPVSPSHKRSRVTHKQPQSPKNTALFFAASAPTPTAMAPAKPFADTTPQHVDLMRCDTNHENHSNITLAWLQPQVVSSKSAHFGDRDESTTSSGTNNNRSSSACPSDDNVKFWRNHKQLQYYL
ncbi:hypothetical protein Pelo_10623 [Pelomyxa schiedti]|nr:hypothetical protein Pelo_10623 [Pelomyxa schiedti]